MLLILLGVRGAAEYHQISERTLFRRFRKEGISPRIVVAGMRRQLALELHPTQIPVFRIVRNLGFYLAQTYARFLRGEFGASASDLRRRLLEGPAKRRDHSQQWDPSVHIKSR